MLNFIDEDITSFNEFDTSDIEDNNDLIGIDIEEDLYTIDNYDNIIKEDSWEENDFHLCENYHQNNDCENNLHDNNIMHSPISFTGSGRCKLCDCGCYAGIGNVCKNCGHFYCNHFSK